MASRKKRKSIYFPDEDTAVFTAGSPTIPNTPKDSGDDPATKETVETASQTVIQQKRTSEAQTDFPSVPVHIYVEAQKKLHVIMDSYASHGGVGNKTCGKSQELILRVHELMSAFSDALGPMFSALRHPMAMTQAATGLGVKSVRAALFPDNSTVSRVNENVPKVSSRCVPLPVCSDLVKADQSSKAKGERLKKKFPNILYDKLRHWLHYYYGKQKPIVLREFNQHLLKEFAEFGYILSATSLWRLMRSLGIRYRKVLDRVILFEKPNLVRWRHTYLKTVKGHRDDGAFLVYLDETWIFEGMKATHDWINVDAYENPSEYLKKKWKLGPTPAPSRGKRAIVIGAICESGIVPGSFKVFRDGGRIEEGDYHNRMNASRFEEYLKELCPLVAAAAGSRKPVLIMDNAAYHNRLSEKVPTTNSTKLEITEYLQKQGIRISKESSKKECVAVLVDYIKSCGGRESLKQFTSDSIASSFGVHLLRLPPYHCILNPIEHYWAYLKKKLVQRTSGKEKLEEMEKHALAIVDGVSPEMNRSFFVNAQHEEDKFIRKEGIRFRNTSWNFSLIITPDEDSDVDDIFNTTDDDDDDDDDSSDDDGDGGGDDADMDVPEEERLALEAILRG